jgi:alpha-galactosidase
VAGDVLTVTLTDAAQGLTIRLRYATLDRFGLFTRDVAITNTGTDLRHITRAFSASLHLPQKGGYALTHLDGRWGDESLIRRDPIASGAFSRDSRRITTSHRGLPFCAVDRDVPGLAATEDTGEVWFATLQHSGNWRMIAERARDGRHVLHLGVNDHDFLWPLAPGETLDLPRVVFGHTAHGFGAMSRAFHDLIRDDLAPRRNYVPKVVYNSWYATLFDVDEAGQTALADKAAAMGVELFVMDDGWFAGRKNDHAGLGDWWPDKAKFPNGLTPLIRAVKARGMDFGIWIEPEMVNPDSDLYRAHPEWVLHMDGRDRTVMRNQCILNMGRADVQDHLIAVFDRLLSENPIDFVKWDMNRNASEPGWPDHSGDGREVWLRYVRGVERVWRELRARHPHVVWENCSGGGGRVDLGMMALTEQSWASDITMPPARLQIQEGYSLLFPAGTMAAWVTDEQKGAYSLDFRFHVSMCGALGVGGNLLEWSADDCAQAATHVARFKELRPLIVAGDLYRLASAHAGPVSAVAHVAKDKSAAVVLAFRTHRARIGPNPAIMVQGLEAEAIYRIEGQDMTLSGRALAERGLTLPLRDFQSAVIALERL